MRPLNVQESQKELLLALSLWKVGALLQAPFRYRSGCDLECHSIEVGSAAGATSAASVEALLPDIQQYIKEASFKRGVTDLFWPVSALFNEATASGDGEDVPTNSESESDEG